MKRHISMLLCIMVLALSFAACNSNNSISITDKQKSYAESIYKKAYQNQIIKDTYEKNDLYLISLHLVKYNSSYYLELLYSVDDKPKDRGKGFYTWGPATSRYYKIINGKLSETADNSVSSFTSEGLETVHWDSSESEEIMIEKIYKIAKYL